MKIFLLRSRTNCDREKRTKNGKGRDRKKDILTISSQDLTVLRRFPKQSLNSFQKNLLLIFQKWQRVSAEQSAEPNVKLLVEQ